MDDVYNATPETLTPLDSLDGGAGVDTLRMVATSSITAAPPVTATLKNIENFEVVSTGTVGVNATAASPAAPEVQAFTVSGAAAATYNATIGTSTVAVAGGANASENAAALVTALTSLYQAQGFAVGSATFAPAGPNAATSVNISSAAGVVTVRGALGVNLPNPSFSGAAAPADIPVAVITEGAAASGAVAAVAYSVAGYTDVVSFSSTSTGGANVFGSSTQAIDVANAGGTVRVAGGLSQNVATTGGVTSTGSAGAVTVSNTSQGTNLISVDGGRDVSVTTRTTTGGISIGVNGAGVLSAGSLPTGAISVAQTVLGSSTVATPGGAVIVRGGTSVDIVQTASQGNPSATSTTGRTTTLGDTTVTGGLTTSSVSVSQSAAKTAANFVAGVAGAQQAVAVKFEALPAGESVTVEGLTFTAGVGGATAAQVAQAFSNLSRGALAGRPTSAGTYSGQLSTAGAADNFSSGAANGDTVVFTSSTATSAAGLVVAGSVPALAPTVTEVTRFAAAVNAQGQGGIANGALTVTDVNHAAGTRLGVIKTVTGSNAAAITVNNSGLETLNVTGGAGNITINDGSTLLAGSVLRSLEVNLGGRSGGALTLGTANVQTLNLNLTAASSLDNIAAPGVTALNLGGSASLSATGLAGLTSVEAITLTGTAGLNGALTFVPTAVPGGRVVSSTASLDLSGIAALESIDASASGGAVRATIDGTAVNFIGGAGADRITAAANVSKSMSLGAGNDTFILATDAAVVSAEVSGGEGTDTFGMTAVRAGSLTTSGAAAFKSFVSGFEVLQLNGAVTASADVGLSDLGFGASTTVAGSVSAAQTLTLNQFANGGTLTIAAVQSGTIALANTVAWAATPADTAASYAGNSVNIDLVGTTVDSFDAVTGARTGITPGSITGGTVSMGNVGTVNISAIDLGSSVTGDAASHTMTLTNNKAFAVNIDGNANLNLALTAGATPATIDGSSMTGGLTVTANARAGGTTITGGSGRDVLTASTGTSADTLIGGAGNDTLVSNRGASILTGGAGADTFDVSLATASKLIFTTITDFGLGDTLKLGAGAATFASAKVDLSSLGANATLGDAINFALNGAATGEIRMMDFGGDTYVLRNIGATATGFTDGEDLVVRLSGEVDITSLGFNSTSATLTFG